MTRVYSMPTLEEALGDTSNAINQIVVRMAKYLPAYGVEMVESAASADLIAGHAGQTDGKTVVDVSHCHGLYPTGHAEYNFPLWHWAANQGVIQNLLHAKAITVPSPWVANILRRDMHVNPHVVGWGIDPAEWEPGDNQGYVFWGKTRAEGVCTPQPLIELAARAPEHYFLTTFGQGTPNIRAIGRQPFDRMKTVIRGAAVYLATTLETFGIQTLEAMACGIPVLGFRQGGTADIVQHGVTGYLVEPGDYDGLRAGLDYCLKYRATLGANARSVAVAYTWEKVAEQFAAIYQDTLIPHTGPKVSVIIPCHNYARYVGEAIDSVKAQQTTFPVEMIVALDRCTDDSETVVSTALEGITNAAWMIVDNGNPADTRNAAIQAARGEYIVPLDADDKLGDPRFLQTLADALDADRVLGMAFTGLRMMDADGNLGSASDWPLGYNFEAQCVRRNQVPTCNMFRREAWVRAGGYRRRYCPAEDADLWLRIGALGYRGKQVTTEPWFVYRLHSDSLSAVVRTGASKEPDWVGDKPWIIDGKRPFASDGRPPLRSWPVRNYNRPQVTFVVPCAEHHRALLPDALDSIEAQTIRDWECVVVNDSDSPLLLPAYPWARVVNTDRRGAGHARNVGVQAATAPLVAFLDADDLLSLRFLEKMLRAYARTGRYVYSDWVGLSKAGVEELHGTPEYEPGAVFHQTSIHSINVLIPKAWITQVGGFDEQMTAWEDVEFFMRLAAADLCGVRVPEPLVLYRYQTGSLREHGETIKPELLAYLRAKYLDYMEGRKVCGCSEPVKPSRTQQVINGLSGVEVPSDMVRIEYSGPIGQHPVVGSVTRQNYGRRAGGDTFYVFKSDQQDTPQRFVLIADMERTVTPTDTPPEPQPLEGVLA